MGAVLATLLGAGPALPAATDPPDGDQLAEIVVEARGPRFAAPTTRDSIGRIWAPTFIDGRGPFRLVLDTGASQSAITAELASYLGYTPDQGAAMMLRGVTGAARVPTVRVRSLTVGDLELDGPVLPIVPDALGGADGILGTAGLLDKRIRIDFRHDRITITYSRGEPAPRGFSTLPFHYMRGRLIALDATIGFVRAKAILDTGGQATIGNPALQAALGRHRARPQATPDRVVGATKDIQDGETMKTPAVSFGPIRVVSNSFTFVDAYIFHHWNLTGEPALLVGMDVLGRLDTLIIDFRRHELQVRTNDD